MRRFLHPLNKKTLTPLISAALKSCRKRKTSGTDAEMLVPLLIRTQQLIAIQTEQPHLIPVAEQLARSRVIEDGIHAVERLDWQCGRILREYYLDGDADQTIANRFNVSRPTAQRLRKEGTGKLIDLLLRTEVLARAAFVEALEQALPAMSYGAFFGRIELTNKIVSALADPQGPAIISIVGMGGLGKTALADHCVRRVIPSLAYDKVIWLTVASGDTPIQTATPTQLFGSLMRSLITQLDDRDDVQTFTTQQQLTLIRKHLSASPHLVIIDNLELESDAVYILNQIHGLAEQSKILITSRSHPHLNHVRSFRLGPLDAPDAQQLIAHFAENVPNYGGPALPQTALQQLAARVAGHPLALQLIADLAVRMPLDQLLKELDTAQHNNFDALYRRIFEQKWKQMSDEARTLLMALPLVGAEGCDQAFLRMLSGLDERAFLPGLNQLLTFALLDIRHSAEGAITYHSHALTRSFALALAYGTSAEASTLFTTTLDNSLQHWLEKANAGLSFRQFLAIRNLLQATIDHGLQHAKTASEAANLLNLLFSLITFENNHAGWLPSFERAVEQSAIKDLLVQFRILRKISWLHHCMFDDEQAQMYLTQAEAIARDLLQDDLLLSVCKLARAKIDYRHFRLDAARTQAESVLAYRQSNNDIPAGIGYVHEFLISVECDAGNAEQALLHFEAALNLFDVADEPIRKANTLSIGILTHGLAGNLAKAEACFQQGVRLIDETAAPAIECALCGHMASVYLDYQQPDLAHLLLQQIERLRQSTPLLPYSQALVTTNWGRFYMAQHAYDKALAYFLEASDLWRSIARSISYAETVFYLAVVTHKLNHVDAKLYRSQALKLLEKHKVAHRTRQLLRRSSNL